MESTGIQKPKAWRYVAIFFISAFFALGSLLWDTAKNTVKEVWVEEGRAYDTMWEDAIGLAAVHNEIKLLEKGYNFNSFPVSTLDAINRSQYNKAVAKIPADDLERVYWYRRSFFLPHSYDTANDEQKDSKNVISVIVEQLANIDKYKHASKIVYDVYKHNIVEEYAAYFFNVAKGEDLTKNRKSVLRALHYSSSTLDASAMLSYKKDNLAKIAFPSLRTAYILLARNIIVDGKCDPEVARWWIEASQKTYDVLLKTPHEVDKYLISENARASYKDFVQVYNKKNPMLLHKISQNCSLI